jgi:diguanylate cyclase (GGDEF)-like protein/PAS domain S-box-containing protein
MPAHLPPPPRSASTSFRAPRRLRAALWLAAVLPVLLLCALGIYVLQQSRLHYVERAELLTQNLAGALDRSVSANVEKIDLMLSSVADHLEQQLAGGRLDLAKANAHIESQVARRAHIEGLLATDAEGHGILGTGTGTGIGVRGDPGLALGGLDWFKTLRDRPDTGLLMSPLLTSPLSGMPIVSFSRRYRTPQGGFAGVVSAAVPLSYFSAQLQGIDAGANGSVALRDSQLRLISRRTLARPTPGGAAGDQVGSQMVSADLRQRVEAGLDQATYHTVTPMDAVERSFSFRRLTVAPLLVVVGVSSDEYLRDWHAEARVVASLGLLIALVYTAGGTLLWRMLAQNRQARRRIELLAKVFDNSGEAIMVTDHRYNIVDVNPAYVRQTGYARADMLGRSATLLNAARTTAQDLRAVEDRVRADGLWRGELWVSAAGGREYPAWMSISLVRDAHGEVTHRILSATDITDVKQAEEQIRHLALHDTLTQLPNRVNLLGRIAQALAAARRDNTAVAMLFIDMDRFKNINDTLGHHIGDGLLVQVGQRLRTLVRDSDIVARLGGDEFVVVLTDCHRPGSRAATKLAHNILATLGLPYQVDGHALHSTPSVGISLFPGDGDDADTLMRNADTAMYQAKANGRNGYQFFTAAMNQVTSERLALEAGLRTAIAHGELYLHYQPQLDLSSSRVVAVEALVRWRHPTLGIVPPLKFIPVAEDTGQIEAIGDWVLDEALRQLAQWRRAGHAALRVAVNLSAQQMRGDRFVGQVSQALQRHHLPGDALELEITESVAMHDPARTAVLLRQLRQHGVALAIDDFGTGHSSLAYLKQLPLSCLKLDRSFVMDIEHDPNDAAICTATIQLAHSLGLGVVAEGVETAAQLDFLRRLGCDVVQGYFISKPMAGDDVAAFLWTRQDSATTT